MFLQYRQFDYLLQSTKWDWSNNQLSDNCIHRSRKVNIWLPLPDCVDCVVINFDRYISAGAYFTWPNRLFFACRVTKVARVWWMSDARKDNKPQSRLTRWRQLTLTTRTRKNGKSNQNRNFPTFSSSLAFSNCKKGPWDNEKIKKKKRGYLITFGMRWDWFWGSIFFRPAESIQAYRSTARARANPQFKFINMILTKQPPW
jgi:hypothetical protein